MNEVLVSWRWRYPILAVILVLAGVVALQLGYPVPARGLLVAGLIYAVVALVGPRLRR